MYIFVESENKTESIESTSHPTEKGLPLTTTVKRQPIELSIQGRIVKTEKYNVFAIIKQIEKLMNSGSLVTYKGRTSGSNYQIQSFDRDYDYSMWGGCKFSMELKQVRIAKSSYVAKKPTHKKQKNKKKKKPVLKVGATVVFKGGNVYVSSDAKKAAARRGRSTCKITIISTKPWSKHDYHLISKDGKKVYGWVDKANIEGVPTSSTGKKTKKGTKQTSKGKGKKVYHTVKKGQTVWGLVNKNYKSLGKSVSWVIANNPKAFKKKGDPKTLKLGAKLWVGNK